MNQTEVLQFLYRDLQIVKSNLLIDDYDGLFEQEMQEYFPFNDDIMVWLTDLYASEKYSSYDESQLSLYYEKNHPFLFIRDLAHINNWYLGYDAKDRRDHITGMIFSGTPQYALEATICLCRPSQIKKEVSHWFDFKQAMTNLDFAGSMDWSMQAWKVCGLFYLYFHLSDSSQSIQQEDLLELISPYVETIEIAKIEGSHLLKKECAFIEHAITAKNTQHIVDGLFA